MSTDILRLDDVHAIRRYVNETLCEKDQLEANSFPVTRTNPGAERCSLRRAFLFARPQVALPDRDLGDGQQHDFVLRFARRAVP